MREKSIWEIILILLLLLIRLVLRGEVFGFAGHAVLVGATVDFRDLGEIAVGRRRWRLPFERGRIPRIIRLNLWPIVDAPKEINDERDLRQH